MGAAVRGIDRAKRLAERFLRDAAATFREARVSLGMSQAHVASAAGVSRTRYGRIEAGRVPTLTIVEFAAIAVVLGLDPSVRLYPGGPPVRDSAQASRIRRFTEHVRAPLRARTEAVLPSVEGRTELRAWDLMIEGRGERTAAEFETRLSDVQALWRRIGLKRRDDPVDHFLLVVADTRTNRRVLSEFAMLLQDLPRLRPSVVRRALAEGRHPPSGMLLF